MGSFKSIRNLILVAVFALIVYAFNFPEHTAKNFAYPIPNQLQTGDVILRDSKGILGSFFRNFSREERKYSHAGFIFIDDKIWVCHYIDNDTHSGLIKEELQNFVDKNKCNGFGIYRFPLTADAKDRLQQIILNSIVHSLPFDQHFDLNSDDKLYCTEWISKSLWKAASIKIAATNAGGMEYVAPDNVYLHNNANLVYKSPSLVMLRYEASHANLTMRIDD